MTRLIAALALLCLFAGSAAHASPAGLSYCASDQTYRQACGNSEKRIHGHARVNAPHREATLADARGYCRRETAAGTIIIACHLADRMAGFIGDVVARGFKGRVHCFSTSRTHVAHSLHFIAEACDFAQHGWGKTVRPMYRVADLAAKWGLRDGCTFRDCGHIDSGRSISRVASR